MLCSELLFRLNEDVCGGETHVRQDYQPGKAGNVPAGLLFENLFDMYTPLNHKLHCDDKSLKVEPDVLSSSGVKCQNL